MKAVEWSNFGLIVFHNGAIYSFADVLFGGRKIQQGLKVENRIFTSIEQGIVKGLSDLMLNDLSAAFDPLTAISFQRDRIETNPRFAMVARPEDIVIILELNVTMETRVARIDLVFPYATLEPIKKLLLKSFLESATGQDPQWNRHFEDELKLTAVDLNVVIHSHPMEIEDLKQLEVGSTIVLDVLANEPIGAEINDMKVAEGKLGRAGDSMAFKLTTPIDAVAFKF
jgi:flagellar motor switch protein FliM